MKLRKASGNFHAKQSHLDNMVMVPEIIHGSLLVHRDKNIEF